jgi:hypothetical protein
MQNPKIKNSYPLFLLLKIKLIGCHFNTTEVIKAESQVVLKSLTEQDFQNTLKNLALVLGTLHMHGTGLLQG